MGEMSGFLCFSKSVLAKLGRTDAIAEISGLLCFSKSVLARLGRTDAMAETRSRYLSFATNALQVQLLTDAVEGDGM